MTRADAFVLAPIMDPEAAEREEAPREKKDKVSGSANWVARRVARRRLRAAGGNTIPDSTTRTDSAARRPRRSRLEDSRYVVAFHGNPARMVPPARPRSAGLTLSSYLSAFARFFFLV